FVLLFSSRRRHTSSKRDWSSDVCSSDLRTYRRKARKQYLALSKQRQPSTDKIRKGIHQQLGYVRRNLKHVGTLATETGLHKLSKKQYRDLLVIQELYRQQAI